MPEAIERAGGVPLINRVGHAFIKQRMREEDAVFGGEVSGHYYFKVLAGGLGRRAVPAHARADLEAGPEALRHPAALARALLPDRRAEHAGSDVAQKLEELQQRFADEGQISHLDGISVDADEWHMNVRPSNTEPLLRLNLEARSRDLMERKRDEVLAVIQE